MKIPATLEGLPAISAALANGISVNVTLIFDSERYRRVMDAYMTGLEQAKANGHDLSGIHSVAAFFVSRVDSAVDKRLKAIGGEAEALLWRGGDRERPARLVRVRRGASQRSVEGARRRRCQSAAAALGIDRGKGPCLRG